MEVHIAINLMHCRGHFREEETADPRSTYTYSNKSTLATGERLQHTFCQLQGSELKATSTLFFWGGVGVGGGSKGTERGWKEGRDLYHHKAQEAALK